MDRAIEEFAEAIHALQRYRREATEKNLDRLQEEIADAYNMLLSLFVMFGDDEILQISEKKIDRLLEKLKRDKYNTKNIFNFRTDNITGWPTAVQIGKLKRPAQEGDYICFCGNLIPVEGWEEIITCPQCGAKYERR